MIPLYKRPKFSENGLDFQFKLSWIVPDIKTDVSVSIVV